MACACRVSTRRQKVDSQKADSPRWRRGQAVPSTTVHWFDDVDRGTTRARPACDRMQQGIFLGTITTGVVWKLERISRRQREGLHLLAEWCDRGGRVVVITQQRDLSGAGGAPRGGRPLWLSRDCARISPGTASRRDGRGQTERLRSRPGQGDNASAAGPCPAPV